ncbi:MAG: WG repeat-containing protein, partial [Moraxella sp.]|nr:WG repeat-containing protein [Moraxella sp.]
LAVVKNNGKYGFIDKTGKVVIPLKYDDFEKSFYGGRIFAEVKRNGRTYYVSRLGDEYTAVGSVSEGLVWVGNNNKYGYVDTTGKVVIALQYDDAWSFSEGLAVVKNNGKYGFIDKTGKMVIAPQYDHYSHFKNGQAKVGLDDGKTPRDFYIDKTGKILTKRSSLAEFRKKLAQGDDVRYKTSNDGGKGMIFEIKGNLVQVQTTESQCTQRDYKGSCQNYVKNPVAKWVKRSEIYPSTHFD